jgi:hypothetical protein
MNSLQCHISSSEDGVGTRLLLVNNADDGLHVTHGGTGVTFSHGTSASTGATAPTCTTERGPWTRCFLRMAPRWGPTSRNVTGDGLADDDGLCEWGETCVYTANLGAYQGEGDAVESTRTIPDGLVSWVTLGTYESNGVT